MDNLNLILNLPPIYGDISAEIESEISRIAQDFFGSGVGLEFPIEYYARVPTEHEWDEGKEKQYVVKDLTVRKLDSVKGAPSYQKRTVDLPPAYGNNADELVADIRYLAREFFGSDFELGTPLECHAIDASWDDAPAGKNKKRYVIEGCTVTHRKPH